MKKVLAVLLAVLMAFSVCVLCVSAEDETAGTVYKYADGLPRIKATAKGPVIILQGGDSIEFGAITANTNSTAKRIEVIDYPDAAAVKASNIRNSDWKENQVSKYNLDSEKWQTGQGQTAADLMAKSPNYFKTFYTYEEFLRGDVAVAKIAGMGDLAHARDSAGIDRGDLENGNAIDYTLNGAKFVGWALYDHTTWQANKTATVRVEVYALWDRGAAPETPDEPEKPDTPDTPEGEYDTPIQATLAKWLAKIEEIFSYIEMGVAGLPAALAMLLNDGFRNWIYGIFGIEA